MDPIQFLKTIFEYAETGYTQIFTLPSATARAVPVTDFSQVPAAITAAGQQNIYFSPGLCAAEKNSKLSDADIIGITAFWADVDMFHPAHAAPNLPRTVQEAMSLAPECLPPSIIVHSGHGLQFWWLLKEAWVFDAPEEKTRAKDLLTRLQGHIRQQAQASGWHLDSVQDLCRVMRLPGTLNIKIPMEPVWAQVIEHSPDLKYDPGEIDEILPVMEQVAAATKPRTTAFERRPTDGPASYMLQNCMFMQHCQLNAKTISYQEWLAMITNMVRATDGIDAVHTVSALDTKRYTQADTDKKIDEALGAMNPQNCQYIQQIGFQGCPPGGCGVQAPCGWSLGKVPQARAILKSIPVLTPEEANRPEVIGALAVIQKEAPIEYDSYYQRYQGNKNSLKSALNQYKKEAAGLNVIDGGGNTETAPNGDRYLAEFVPDVPINLKMPSSHSHYMSWIFGPKGISLKRATDKGETYSEASYVPVVISERIYNIDNKQEKAAVSFKTHRGTWRKVILPKSVIFDTKKIICLADSGLTINSDMAKNLAKWLTALEAANAQNIPERDGVSKLGWRNHDSEFILPGMQTQYALDIEDSASEAVISGFGIAGDFAVWIDAMRKMRTRNKARFIMAASFAAPLLKIVGQRTFLIHNWGTTADGKSAALYAALSAWGDPDNLKQTFNQTTAFIERAAELFTDLPLGINEYEVLSERKKGEVDPIIYMIGEGKGRGRATKQGLQKTAQWRTIAIMNGESPITRSNSRGGILTRVIELHGGPLVDDKNFASDLYRITAKNHGHAGRFFIEQLLKANFDELRDVYDKTRYALRARYPDKLESHLDALACIALADYLVSMWIFGLPKDAAGSEAVTMTDGILVDLVAKSEADESERAWAWLQDWLAANDGRFMKTYSQGNKYSGPIIGYVEAGFVNIIKTELSNAMKLEGFSPEKVFRAWAEKGKIPCSMVGEKRTFAVRGKTINGARPYVISIKSDV